MLDRGQEGEGCRFYATNANWEKFLGAGSKYSYRSGNHSDSITEELDARGKLTEVQIMRIGYAQYNLMSAASTLDRMPDALKLPDELRSVIDEIVEALAVASDWLYELKGDAVIKVKRIGGAVA
jgi:hypothetical protein